MIKRAAGDEGSGDGGRVANTAPSGSELSRPSSTNQNSKPRNKSLTIRPATVCRRTELMIEKRARLGGSVSAETFSRPEPILGHPSLRGGIPFPGKLALSCRWPAPALAMWQIEHTSELF